MRLRCTRLRCLVGYNRKAVLLAVNPGDHRLLWCHWNCAVTVEPYQPEQSTLPYISSSGGYVTCGVTRFWSPPGLKLSLVKVTSSWNSNLAGLELREDFLFAFIHPDDEITLCVIQSEYARASGAWQGPMKLGIDSYSNLTQFVTETRCVIWSRSSSILDPGTCTRAVWGSSMPSDEMQDSKMRGKINFCTIYHRRQCWECWAT